MALIGLGLSSGNGFRDGYRGLELSAEDRVRAWFIGRLMCDFGFSADDAADPFGATANPGRAAHPCVIGTRSNVFQSDSP